MKKLSLILLLAFGCFFAVQAQEESQGYRSALGLRLGYPLSVSYKTFISNQGAIEVYAGFRGYDFYNFFNVGGLYQHHFNIPDLAGLRWYIGGGAAAYFYNFDDGFADDADGFGIGISPNVGLDYKFANAPINLSLDWLPVYFLSGYGDGFAAGYGGLAVRYTLR